MYTKDAHKTTNWKMKADKTKKHQPTLQHLGIYKVKAAGRETTNCWTFFVIYSEYSALQIAACNLFAQHYVSEVVGVGWSASAVFLK